MAIISAKKNDVYYHQLEALHQRSYPIAHQLPLTAENGIQFSIGRSICNHCQSVISPVSDRGIVKSENENVTLSCVMYCNHCDVYMYEELKLVERGHTVYVYSRKEKGEQLIHRIALPFFKMLSFYFSRALRALKQ